MSLLRRLGYFPIKRQAKEYHPKGLWHIDRIGGVLHLQEVLLDIKYLVT